MPRPTPVARPDARPSLLVDLALQGGGAHGAFTWGVLDRLLEERLAADRRHLRHVGRRHERRRAGRRLRCRRRRGRPGGAWRRSGAACRMPRCSARSGARRSTSCSAAGRSITRRCSSPSTCMRACSRPTISTRCGVNPLREILAECVDFDAAGASADQAVRHRHQRAHRPRPRVSQRRAHARRPARLGLPADHVPGRRDRRRALLGRRLRRQSHHHAAGARVHVERHDPGADQSGRAAGTPRSARDILNRLNEVSFNATLLKELRMIALLRQVADPGNCEGARWAEHAHPPHRQRR